MSRPLFDSEYLFGIHDPGGEQIMLDAGVPGWVLVTESIGADPADRSGQDYRALSDRGLGVICRLNHGYHPQGTIPSSQLYEKFAQRCANFVAASAGCKIWIIGNEMNYAVERPHAGTRSATPLPPSEGAGETSDPRLRGQPDRFSALHPQRARSRSSAGGEPITPALYVRCFQACRNAIRRLPGHGDDQVVVGAVAPWNDQTRYEGNALGDWVQYLADILRLLGPQGCDAIALHTYTHAADANQIHDDVRMSPPFAQHHYNFRAYQDFMAAIPAAMRHLPVYITETDQDVPWEDRNIGWVQRAYGEIDHWNQQPGHQQIRALILYRWPRHDRWYIEGKAGVIEDLRAALPQRYRWRPSAGPTPAPPPADPAFTVGTQVTCLEPVNLRRSAGYQQKAADDVLTVLAAQSNAAVVAGPQIQDQLIWWELRAADAAGQPITGWVAQTGPDGRILLAAAVPGSTPAPVPAPTAPLAPGRSFVTADVVNLRRTPGYLNKGADDLIQEIPVAAPGTVRGGPQTVDGLTWWEVTCRPMDGAAVSGWMAQFDTLGRPLMVGTETPLPAPTPPPAGTFQAGARAFAAAYVNVRRDPGYVNKPGDHVLDGIALGAAVSVTGGPQGVDGLTWWQIQATGVSGQPVSGWAAETDPNGVLLLSPQPPRPPVNLPAPAPMLYAVGDLICNISADAVNLRASAGYLNKPPTDVVATVPSRASLAVQAGPRAVDGLFWWQVRGALADVGAVGGWLAEAAPSGVRLMAPAHFGALIGVGRPFQGPFGLSQSWGSNPGFYARFTYDGVALRGHNGLDFGMDVGTPLLAAAGGTVIKVDFESGGFGHHILLQHRWGESLYAHLDQVQVAVGQPVVRGQRIGLSGQSGVGTGPHLHFGIRILPYRRADGWGGFTDPAPYMDAADLARSRGPQEVPVPMAPEVPGRSRP